MSPEANLDSSEPKRAKTFSIIGFSIANSLKCPVENAVERNLMETGSSRRAGGKLVDWASVSLNAPVETIQI